VKAIEIINEIILGADKPEITCDTVKHGDPEKEVKKLAVTMFATVDVLKRAKEWGADMIIVHEPTYYDHMDKYRDDPVVNAKKALIEELDMVIFRYHDHMHRREKDQITYGQAEYLGLSGKITPTQYGGSSILESDRPITASELVRHMREDLGIPYARAAGAAELPARRIGLCFGTPSGVAEILAGDADMVITGEASEWRISEYARDAALLGMNKSLIVMGHIGSEAGGMMWLKRDLEAKHPDLELEYFESGSVYI
jgi:putative NIF3 family GTP cyclohydrolase 1 type 2